MIDYREAEALELLTTFSSVGMAFTDNTQYGFTDSAVLYSMVRKCDYIVEVGCGFSTGIINQSFEGSLVCIDPSPRTGISADEHLECKVQDVSLDEFEKCDLLFIDSSHFVVQGGDLPFLFFDVLPVLKPNTLIHFHDIFLPGDYAPSWLPRGYGEMYLLRAFLENNNEYSVIWPGHLMATKHKVAVEKQLGQAVSAGSFWIRKEAQCW